MAVAILNLGNVARDRGELAPAAGFFREALAGFRDLGDLSGIAFALEAMSPLALHTECAAAAARWLGAAEAIRTIIDEPIPVEQREGYAAAVDEVRARLGKLDFATAWQEGQSGGWETAADEALAVLAAL
jgi:hypothetical protein